MTNFAEPTNLTNVSTVLSALKARDESIARMDYSSDTNIEAGFIRLNKTNRTLEEWMGSAWAELRLEQPGIIKPFAGTTAPRGHLMCDGAEVSRSVYAELFAVVGETYGAGNGATTFNLPDLRGRFPLGRAISGTGSALAATGGTLDHIHSIPAHYHQMGAGADLNVSDSGTHTTTINISHGHTASSTANFTGITIPQNKSGDAVVSLTDPGHVHAVTDPGHSHIIWARDGGPASSTARVSRQTSNEGDIDIQGRSAKTNVSIQKGYTGISLTNGTHSHSISFNDPTHNHPITVNALTDPTNRTDTSGSHRHLSESIAGRIGLVTGGVDGNALMNSGANNPPFISLNYIITI